MEANQQPICEAFIMTGESMLKLSRNETESCSAATGNSHTNHSSQNHNNPINTAAAIHDNSQINNNGPKQAAPSSTSENTKQDDKQTARRLPIEFKSGLLDRKIIFEARGKPTGRGRRGWRRVFVTLKDLRLIIRATDPGQQAAQPHQQQPEPGKLIAAKPQELSSKIRRLMITQSTPNNVKLHHSFAKRADNYIKREYVFRLRFADQSEFLLQASNEQEMNSWIEMINFASACLSSPALPCAVSSGSRYLQRHQRPILPASYTKLTYWEQLIDHEERLQRLKQELEEHLNEAPAAKNADKRSKSEFIERIAYLRQEIERYTVYVELMRKSSNSAEAIILSKHPQNASMASSTGIGAPSRFS